MTVKPDQQKETIVSEMTHRVNGQEVIGKLIAYHKRFGDFDESEAQDHERYILPTSVCQQELKAAEHQLLFEGRHVKSAKLMPIDYSPDELGSIEINTDGRRYAIPRDYCVDIYEMEAVNIETAVVSVLDEDNWPDDIYSNSPQSTEALNEIADGPLVDDVRDLAIHLQLGDRVPYIKNSILQQELYARTLEKFGVDNISDVKKILKQIGVKIIDTSVRTVESRAESGHPRHLKLGSKAIILVSESSVGVLAASARTEIDALLEAIHKTS